MANKVKPVPEGYRTLTPSIVVRDGARAIDFYKRAFGAVELGRFEMQGKIGHAEIRIGDSIIMLADEFPSMGSKSPQTLGGTPVNLFLYVEDADASFKRAVDEGATVDVPLTDMFWGDRFGKVTDPFGHSWAIATRIEEVSRDEMNRRAAAAMAQGTMSATE